MEEIVHEPVAEPKKRRGRQAKKTYRNTHPTSIFFKGFRMSGGEERKLTQAEYRLMRNFLEEVV